MPRADGQSNPVRYVPPLELRRPAYTRSESIEPPDSHSRRSDETSWRSHREETRGFSYATADHSSQSIPSLNVSHCHLKALSFFAHLALKGSSFLHN